MITKKLTNQKVSQFSDIVFSIHRENLSKQFYQEILSYDLILKQNYRSIMQLPRLDKIVLNTTSKTYVNEKKNILFTLAALELISGQKPQLTYARKSVANFKVRQDQIIGCKVVLRENLMYAFLDKLSKIIFPRIREIPNKKNLTQININKKTLGSQKLAASSFGFKNLMIFPELEKHYELVDNFKGMNVSFVLSNSTNKPIDLFLVLSGFQLPIS